MQKTISFLVLVAVCTHPILVTAAIPVSYHQGNIFTATHDRPVSLFTDEAGGFFGYTQHGFYFTQTPVANSFGIKLHRFAIDQAFFYMSDKGLIKAETDLAAVSIYLSRA